MRVVAPPLDQPTKGHPRPQLIKSYYS